MTIMPLGKINDWPPDQEWVGPYEDNIHNTPLNKFGWSARVWSMMQTQKVYDGPDEPYDSSAWVVKPLIYVGDLIALPRGELLRIPNFGDKSLAEIEATLAQRDLRVGSNPSHKPIANLSTRLQRIEARLDRLIELI